MLKVLVNDAWMFIMMQIVYSEFIDILCLWYFARLGKVRLDIVRKNHFHTFMYED